MTGSLREHLRSLRPPDSHIERPRRPARGWAIVACMDARFPVERLLGLDIGDAHVLRNAGAAVTEDVLRSLVISTQLLGTREVALIGHTGCGLRRLDEDQARRQIEAAAARHPEIELLGFASLRAHLREGIRRVATHPLLPREIEVTGVVYDDRTGSFIEITPESDGGEVGEGFSPGA